MPWCRGMRRARQSKRRVPQFRGLHPKADHPGAIRSAWHAAGTMVGTRRASLRAHRHRFDTARTWQKTYRPAASRFGIRLRRLHDSQEGPPLTGSRRVDGSPPGFRPEQIAGYCSSASRRWGSIALVFRSTASTTVCRSRPVADWAMMGITCRLLGISTLTRKPPSSSTSTGSP